MEHPEELVDHILSTYYADPSPGAVSYSREHLLFEAKVMAEELMHPVLVEIGHINPQRWRRIADTYATMGMAEPLDALEGFIYDPNPEPDYHWFYVALGLLLGVALVGALARIWNKRLHRAVTQRTGELRESNQKHERLVDNLIDTFLYRHDVEGVFNYVSSSVTQVLGYSTEAFLDTQITPQCGQVKADATQIHQIVMNLCTNAYHAMRESGGRLKLTLDEVYVKDRDVVKYEELRPGAHLRLTVRDTGCGMTEEVRARLFEPYFTTREQGEGTGLGLATVHGIVSDHQGAIQVHSAPGKGTTFEVLFPVCGEVGPKPQKRPAEGDLPRGTERVLLVDDEEAIVGFMERRLTLLGYSVKAFTSSNKAYKEFKAAPGAFDLVITDHTMPKLTGFNLARRLLAIRPDLPIILCTGNSETVDEKKTKAAGIAKFHLKPVSSKELAHSVRAVLNRRA